MKQILHATLLFFPMGTNLEGPTICPPMLWSNKENFSFTYGAFVHGLKLTIFSCMGARCCCMAWNRE